MNQEDLVNIITVPPGSLYLAFGVYIPVFIIGLISSYEFNVWTYLARLLSIFMNLFMLASAMRLIALKKNVHRNMTFAAILVVMLLVSLTHDPFKSVR